ncbi:hypothetical protein [Ferrimicrobium acidiphilum]|uniref:Uncharacterized protein n=2 Tax=Ferrimicrobium acidiphilum TaxID=121039 RepID=A0A0D8FS85_9ACTN|nr:hypothetical protein [Ferrimicrobium acidiphilum]KJE75991.1 hypothetical protein FEAC_22880 [Ferrimicrobium acidiphilum DSM 19497]
MELGALLDSLEEGELSRHDQVHRLISVLAGEAATGDDVADLLLLSASCDQPLSEPSVLLNRLLAASDDEFSGLLTALIELRDLTLLQQFC